MENVHEETRNGLLIRISRDENADGPSGWGDKGLFLVGYHRDFSEYGPKDKRGYYIITKEDAQTIARMDFAPPAPLADADDAQAVQELGQKYHFFPLSAYIHSGVRLYCGKISRSWDNSLLGLIAVSREEWPDQDQAEKAAEGLVSTWNDYMSGNVYGFQIEDAKGNDIDSCWGFYGDYDKDGGALLEARAIVDHRTNKGKTDHTGQLLMPWAPEVAPAVK